MHNDKTFLKCAEGFMERNVGHNAATTASCRERDNEFRNLFQRFDELIARLERQSTDFVTGLTAIMKDVLPAGSIQAENMSYMTPLTKEFAQKL